MVNSEHDLTGLTALELRRLVGELLGEVVRLREENAALKEEVARLKGLKGRPKIKPSGMVRATGAKTPGAKGKPARRGKTSRRVAEERQTLTVAAPPGSRFKGYEDFVVQDLRLSHVSSVSAVSAG